jgi:plastocyanin
MPRLSKRVARRGAGASCLLPLVVALPTLLALSVGAPGAAGDERPPTLHHVEIRDFAFAPAHLEVAIGDTVVWTNRDFVPHTATVDDGTWDSGILAADQSWKLVVRQGGAYHCALHGAMKATLVLR